MAQQALEEEVDRPGQGLPGLVPAVLEEDGTLPVEGFEARFLQRPARISPHDPGKKIEIRGKIEAVGVVY